MKSNFDGALKSFTNRVINDVAKYDKKLTVTTSINQRWGIYGVSIGNKSRISINKKTGEMHARQNGTGNLFNQATWTRLIASAISAIAIKD